MDAYTEAHLFVSAIRLLKYQSGHDPRLDEVCSLLTISTELGHTLRRKLEKAEIIKSHEDPFSVVVSINNHLEIENLSKNEQQQNQLEKELEAFKQKKRDGRKKLSTIQAELENKRKAMFTEIEAKLTGQTPKR